MAATSGPGRGAQVKNTSANQTTPSSRTTFIPKVSGLVTKFNKTSPASNMEKSSAEGSGPTPPSSTGSSPKQPTESSSTQSNPPAAPAAPESPELPPLPPSNESSPEGAMALPDTADTETAEERLGREIVTWATRADRTNTDQDYKLTIWFRKNSTAPSTTLSTKEKGRLVFKLLGVPRGKCLQMDVNKRDRIVLTILGEVPASSLNLSQSFQVKTNLWTRPVAPVIREKLVYINWTTSDTEYQDLERVLSHFGTLTSNIQYQVYRARPGADEDEMLMDGVLSMDRECKMKVRRNIPSIILVAGKKVNIRYDGQARSCPRCLERLHICPAKGDPRRCQELWDNRDDPDDGPHQRAKPRGNLIELMNTVMGVQETNTMDSSEESGIHADFVDVCNIPDEMDEDRILDFLSKKDIHLEPEQLRKVENKWRLVDLMPQEVQCVMLMVHKAKIGSAGRRIECYPAIMSTPTGARLSTFNPSRDNSRTENPVARSLSGDMKNLEDGREVSPNDTNVQSVDPKAGSHNNDLNLSPKNSSGSSVEEVTPPMDTESGDDDDEEIKEVAVNDDDDDIKEVTADDKTLPKAAKITLVQDGAGYATKAQMQRRRTVSVGSSTEVKAALKTKKLAEEADQDYKRAQAEAEEKAKKANETKDENDFKLAEKAKKAAATAKKKFLVLEAKYDMMVKKSDELKRMSEAGKRSAEDQSPGKDDGDDEDWNTVSKGKKKDAKNRKKKAKEKTSEELEIEKSLFDGK